MNIKSYHNVAKFYNELCLELSNSRESIDLIYFSFVDGYWGEKISKILEVKAQEGMKVRLMVDPIGQLTEDMGKIIKSFKMFGKLKNNKVQVKFYKHKRWLLSHQHIKACIIDKKIFIFGGSNIADHYINWEDSNFIYTGDLPEDILSLYDFCLHTPRSLQVDKSPILFSTTTPSIYLTVPNESNRVKQALISLINGSQKSLRIQTWYFLPDKDIQKTLEQAVARGVDVQIIISQSNRMPIINLLNLFTIKRLVSKGVKIFQWTKNYRHQKLYWNDKNQVLLGSANIEPFSMRLNFEMLVSLNNKTLADSLDSEFESTKLLL